MNYNPDIHHRRSIRLKGYDYSRNGLYFITICCADRICRFGFVGAGRGQAPPLRNQNATMVLNELGQIAYDEWTKLPQRFPNMEMDVFQIMPNHLHAIIVLNSAVESRVVGAGLAPALGIIPAPDINDWAGASPAPTTPVHPAPTIGNIIGGL